MHTDIETLNEDGEGAQSNLENGKNVSAETCIPDWGGESMDGDMVVGALMELDQ